MNAHERAARWLEQGHADIGLSLLRTIEEAEEEARATGFTDGATDMRKNIAEWLHAEGLKHEAEMVLLLRLPADTR